MEAVATLRDPVLAELVLHPLRRRILEEAVEAPVSATEVARRAGETRQRVNYHLRALADAGLLEPAGEIPRRGLTEKLYAATARCYTLAPEMLGRLAPSAERLRDRFSAATLLALAQRVQSDLVRVSEQARSAQKRVATLSIDTEVRFRDERQQAEFAAALTQAVADVVSLFSDPATSSEGHRYRLVAGAYPAPAPAPPTRREA